jgi:hypothetical protein
MLDRRIGPPPPPGLHWLPPMPQWDERLRGLERADAQGWSELVALANAGLDSLDTLRLDRKLTRLFGRAPPPGLPTTPVRLALLASSTVDHLRPGIRVGALRRGIWLDIHTVPYGQYSQALLDTASELHRYRPDTVLFAFDACHLLGGIDPASPAGRIQAELDRLCGDLARNWRLAREAFGCRVIQQTLLPVFASVVGNNKHRLPGAAAWLVQDLNQRLRGLADAEQVDLLAIDSRVAQDGLRGWHDPALWFRAKQEVHPAAAAVYGDLLGRLLAARQGRSEDAPIWLSSHRGRCIGGVLIDKIVVARLERRLQSTVDARNHGLYGKCWGELTIVDHHVGYSPRLGGSLGLHVSHVSVVS